MNRPVQNKEVIAVALAALVVALLANIVTFVATSHSVGRNSDTIAFLCDTRDIDDTVVQAMNQLLKPAPQNNQPIQDFRDQLTAAHRRLQKQGPCDDQTYQPSAHKVSSRSKYAENRGATASSDH